MAHDNHYKRVTCLYSIKIMSYLDNRWERCSCHLCYVLDTIFSPVHCSHVHVIDTPTNSDIFVCPHGPSLTICSFPPSVPAHRYSIRSTVFYLVPSSISDSNTGYGYTCLFGYCVWLKLTIVLQNVIYNIPPLTTAYDLCQQMSGILISIHVCSKEFVNRYWLTYCVISYSIILLLKYGFGLQGIINYRHTISIDLGSSIYGNAHHS